MSSRDKAVEVQIAEGSLLGRKTETVRGAVQYFSFQGIPYAQPPIGDLRFQAPVPVQPWSGVRKALKEGAKAPGVMFGSTLCDTTCSEDCLYLNVYTKHIPTENSSNKTRPVMFFIHGGGFCTGSGSSKLYGPDYLITKDVVLVTINYRLGALGFLSLQNKLCPGNNGLKDQVEALRWTRRNIAAFGGDPNNVTIFGNSAGGASVQFLMLSPLSKGLYHKAITQSGSALNPWAVAPHPLDYAFALGEELGFKTTDSKLLFNFLKTVPAVDLVEKSSKLRRKLQPEACFLNFSVFTPVPEPNLPGAFLTKPPAQLINEGSFHDVPYIVGINQFEGPIMMKVGSTIKEPRTRTDWNKLLPVHPAVRHGSALADAILEKIRNYYFANGFTKEGYANILSWVYFLHGNDHVLQSLSKTSERKSKTYFYHFTFEGSLAYIKRLWGFAEYKGTFHGDELAYLFSRTSLLPSTVSEGSDNDKTIDTLTRLWTDFARTGEPTPHSKLWKPYTWRYEEYLDINVTLTAGERLYTKEAQLWRSIWGDIAFSVLSKL